MAYPIPIFYALRGSQLSVGYGTGVAAGLGPFVYQDPHLTRTFSEEELRIVATEIGTLVTVTIHRVPGEVEFGSTTFTLLVPELNLEEGISHPVPIETIGITTLHRPRLPHFDHGQTEVYTLTPLTGTARWFPL